MVQTCSYHISQQWINVYGCWSLSIQHSPGVHWLRRWAVVLYHIIPVNDIVIIRDMWVTVCTNTDIQSMNNYYIVLNGSNSLFLIYLRFHASPQIHHGLLFPQRQVWFMKGVVEMTDHSSFPTAVNTHLLTSRVISENTIWWSDSSNHIAITRVRKW